MLYHDSFFTIGKAHQVCEDFAVQGESPIPFIVICDGCSASAHSDVGARILALTSKHIVENATNWPLNYLSFGQQLIIEALHIVKGMEVTIEALDSTVVLAFLHQSALQVYMYGDGALFFKDQAGHLSTLEVSFTHNAPFYLSYWLDKMRQEEYAKCEPKPLIIKDSVNGSSKPLSFKTSLSFNFALEKFPTVAIASDGVAQCLDLVRSEKLPLARVGNDLLDFKKISGDFVKQHCQQVLINYAKQRIFPLDDLSVGVFVQQSGD